MSQKLGSLQENLKEFEKKQIVISVLGLIIFIGLSVIFNRLFMQSAAEQTAKLITRMVQIDDFREIGLTLQEARLDYFNKIQFESKSLNRSVTFPPIAEYVTDESLLYSLLHERIQIVPPSATITTGEDKIVFEYNRFNFTIYAIALWLLLNLVSIPQTRLIKKRIIKQFDLDLELQRKSTHAEISRKVRHNINTPLAALMAMTDRLKTLKKEDQDLFESIVRQIKHLIKDLDSAEKRNSSLDSMSAPLIEACADEGHQFIYPVLKDSFFEIQAAFSKDYVVEFDIAHSLMSAKVEIVAHELRSIVGNIVQNAIDASPKGAKLKLTARDLSNRIEIQIEDSGRGIPESILSKVTDENFTHGKENGSGLGLYHAKSWIESWGGSLKIESHADVGTTVTILLPILDRANWFAPRLKIRSHQTIVILDDQKSQHLLWKMKLADSDFVGDIHFFDSADDYLTFRSEVVSKSTIADYVFFFDYDLGNGSPCGLDLLQEIPSAAQRCLVTGHFDDPTVQDICDREGISLVPKIDLPGLPLICI